METLVIDIETERIQELKDILASMNISFYSDKPYNKEFVTKILQGDIDRKEGKGRKISIEEMNNLWK